jgi:hypothetical protein
MLVEVRTAGHGIQESARPSGCAVVIGEPGQQRR